MFDAYARLPLHLFQQLTPAHLYSEADDAQDGEAATGPNDTVQGFTEWTAPGERALTFGWDWSFEPRTGQWSGHWETLRTNLMVTGPNGEDLGTECTRTCVSDLMRQVQWDLAVAEALSLYPLRH